MISLEGRSIVGWAAARASAGRRREAAVGLGAQVAVVDVDPGTADLVGPLGAQASFACCDATDPEGVMAVLDAAAARAGGLDGLFITVGGAHLDPIEDVDLAAWNAEINFNLTSAYVTCRAVLPHLKRRGGGAIVTTSSGYAIMAGKDRIGYTAGKAGVIAFTRSLAAIGAPDGIRANCIAPGPTDTPRFRP